MSTSHRVFVHRNTDPRAPKFEVHDLDSGAVTERDELWLADAIFKVSPAGWYQRVSENRRSIHAGVFGTLLNGAPRGVRCECAVCYRANESASFIDEEHRPIDEAGVVHLVDGRVFVSRAERWL